MKNLLAIAFIVILPMELLGQEGIFSSFGKLSAPEKWWVIQHPFIAGKAFRLTTETLDMEQQVAEMKVIDNFSQGGQLDAFRHGYWMALLAQHFRPRKVRRLGEAHERGNYLDFLARRDEEGTHPDLPMTQMDLHNNETGISIGCCNKNLSREELRDLIIDNIHAGRFLVIKMDDEGNFLDNDGEIIPAENLQGRWETEKVLMPSNWREIKSTLKGGI